MKTKKVYVLFIISAFLLFANLANAIPVQDKVAVLITSWGAPAGFNYEYAWDSHSWCRIGDRTMYPGQPCKDGHVGDFPYQSHLGFLPWGLTCSWPGSELIYDNSGIYKLEDGVYIPMDHSLPALTADMIPISVPIVPAVEVTDSMTGLLKWPRDPRDGVDHLAGWYKIGSYNSPLPNGSGDLYEQGPLGFLRRFGILGGPTEPPEAYLENAYVLQIFDYTKQMLEDSFGSRIDVRFGSYGRITGYTPHEIDTTEDFAKEGFRKMLIARETTDNNCYANNYMSGGYVREKLCELGVLNETEIYQTRQVGRTPEFNALNIVNLKSYIEQYPEGSTIGIIYVTRGLPWGVEDGSRTMGTQHPWSKEVYHENAYLNYLSWKKAVQKAFGDRYNLIFTKDGVESDLLKDNFFTYGMINEKERAGIFYSIREALQWAKEDGLDKIIIAPCHWLYDNSDNLVNMREMNDLPLVPRADIDAGKFDITYCEDAEGNQFPCDSANASAKITIAPSYSNLAYEFAQSYYVVLRGTLERFNLYPKGTFVKVEKRTLVKKLEGGTVEVSSQLSPIRNSRIEIPADPYPERPEKFTWETAVPVNDPLDTMDCLWEDTVISIGFQRFAPVMRNARPAGPAVHFGPYRNFFNRDVTIRLPYNKMRAGSGSVGVYIYNHLTKDWDSVEVESIDQAQGFITFKTQVLGLFRAGIKK
jgi:hypothetical protein